METLGETLHALIDVDAVGVQIGGELFAVGLKVHQGEIGPLHVVLPVGHVVDDTGAGLGDGAARGGDPLPIHAPPVVAVHGLGNGMLLHGVRPDDLGLHALKGHPVGLVAGDAADVVFHGAVLPGLQRRFRGLHHGGEGLGVLPELAVVAVGRSLHKSADLAHIRCASSE